jgi:hypothetical protein
VFFKEEHIFQKASMIRLVLIMLAFFTAYKSASNGGDFEVFLDAAQKLDHGQNIYGPPYVRKLQYYYSVFFALLLVPFYAFPFLTAFCWIVFSWWCCYRTLVLIDQYWPFERFSGKRMGLFLFLIVLLGYQFMFYNVANIQMTPFLLWGIFESARLSRQGKAVWAGLLMGLIINIKIMPVLVLPYFFYRGYYKTVVATLATVLLLFFIPAIFIGYTYNANLHQIWWSVVNPFQQAHSVETEIGPHSVVAWLPTLLMETPGDLPVRRHLLNLPASTTFLILQLVRVLLFSLSLYFLRGGFSKLYRLDSLQRFWEFSYFLMLVPLLMPHQQKYSFLFVMPMIIYLIASFLMTPKPNRGVLFKSLLGLFVLCMLVYSPLHGKDIMGKFFFEWSHHVHLLTWATLLIIPIAMYFTPDKLRRAASETGFTVRLVP